MVSAGGCSFIFVDGPPASHAKMPFFECTSSITLPTIDLVLGGAFGLEAVAELSRDQSYGSTRETAIVAAGEAALLTASAIYGYSKTSQCREAKAQLLDRMMRNPPPPPAYGPGFPPPYQPPTPYDPWLAPPPGAFAAPPGAAAPGAVPAPSPWGPAPAAPVPGAAPAAPGAPTPPVPAPPAKAPPAVDDEAPKKGGSR